MRKHGAERNNRRGISRRVEDALRLDVLAPFCPHHPLPKQGAFLLFDGQEAMYGGAGGGGKSDAGLMGGLQYVDTPGHAGLILRRTMTALKQPGALLDRAHKWIGSRARWDSQGTLFRFPSGAALTFGHLKDRHAWERYDSAEFQYIYVDELTQFAENEYLRLMARLRRPSSGPVSQIPLRMRAGTNPGGRGHEWVKGRFVTPVSTDERLFIPATIDDNPHLDIDAYIKTLEHLPPVIRDAILKGNWDLTIGAGMIRREWFEIVPDRPPVEDITAAVRYWDTAATEETGSNDPDWTVGHLAVLTRGEIEYWVHVARVRATSGSVEDLVRSTAKNDAAWLGTGKYLVVKEQGPGDDGKANAARYATMLSKDGIRFRADRKTVDKMERAGPMASAAEAKRIKLVEGEWIDTCLDELANFPGEGHDDQVDAASGAHAFLVGKQDPVMAYYKARFEKLEAERAKAGGRQGGRVKELNVR